MDKITYKNYYSIVKVNTKDLVVYGKIEDIDDLVSFECENLSEVQKAFEQAVDDYLDFCEEVGKTPSKTYSGQFNVRITPSLHKQATIEANKQGVSLNAFVGEAIQNEVLKKVGVYEMTYKNESRYPSREYSVSKEGEYRYVS